MPRTAQQGTAQQGTAQQGTAQQGTVTRRAAKLSADTLALLTVAEAKTLSGEALSSDDWTTLAAARIPQVDLQSIAQADLTHPQGSALIDMQRSRTVRLPPVLRDLVLWGLSLGHASPTLQVLEIAAYVIPPGRRRYALNVPELTRATRTAAAHLAAQPEAEPPGSGWRFLIQQIDPDDFTRRPALVTEVRDLTLALQGLIMRMSELHRADLITALLTWNEAQLIEPVLDLISAAELLGNSETIDRLMRNQLTQGLCLQRNSRLSAMKLPLQEALLWTREHQDALHWRYRRDVPPIPLAELAELHHLAFTQRWADTFNLEYATLTLPTAAWAQIITDFPSPWLARHTEAMEYKSFEALLAAAPETLESLALLSRELRIKLARWVSDETHERRWWAAFERSNV